MKTKNILLTGGAGFIGSAFVESYISNFYQTDKIIILDKMGYASSKERLKKWTDSDLCELFEDDINNRKLVRSIFETFKPEALINMAAETHVDRSIDSPDQFIQSNINGTFSLLEETRRYLQKHKSKNFKFIHVSTDEVFGSIDNEKFTSETKYNPSSPYSASKACSDHLVRAWHRTYDIPTIITNCVNNFGPYQHIEKLIPTIIRKAIAGKPIGIYGNGKNIREWIHVDDHCRAIMTILNKGEIGETYLIGSGTEKTNIQIANDICKILDFIIPSKRKYSDLITFVKDRPGHDLHYAVDSSKIRSLGWSEWWTYEDALKSTINWYLENKSFCKKFLHKRMGLKK